MVSLFRSLLRTAFWRLLAKPHGRSPRRIWLLVIGLVAIVGWQIGFTHPTAKVDASYRITASSGIREERAYFFFLYHLGLLPVATDAPIERDTQQEARRLLRAAPERLRQDTGVTFRSGDRGRVYLYYADAIYRRNAISPSLRPAHALAFVVALCALFAAMWSIRRPYFGALLVVLLGSNPFQLHAVYGEENIFSWVITTMVLVLAIHIPLMEAGPKVSRYAWVAAIGTGLLLATVRTVRSEGMPIILGALMVYFTMANTTWWRRAALVVTLVVTFGLAGSMFTQAITHKFKSAQQTVASVGGDPYSGPVAIYHEFWHAVFCGLGDFDTKYGYLWLDIVAYRYALPHLEKLNGRPLSVDAPGFHDKQSKYPIFFSETPGYHEVVRDKVLGDIRRDPAWYAGILRKRVARLLTDTSPVSVSFWTQQYQTKSAILGWSCLPLFVFLVTTRRHFFAKLLAFSAPLSIAPLIIYSDRGMAWYSCYHIFGAGIFLVLLATGAREWLRSPSVQ